MMRIFAIIMLFFFSVVGCTKKESGTSSGFSAAKTLVVGTDAAYMPFEIEMPDRSVTGFDIELIRAIAKIKNLKIEVINTPWEGLFNQLETGDRDILISAITITEERKKVLDFSEPYFDSVQLIALPKGSKVGAFSELKGKKVGVQIGTTGDEVISQLLGRTNSNIKRFEGTPLALQELLGGSVDAVVADNGVIKNFLANNKKDFKTLSDNSFKVEKYGIAVKKGNSELLGIINEGLRAIKENGTYDQIFQKYFGEVSK